MFLVGVRPDPPGQAAKKGGHGMENQEKEARLDQLEARLSFCEERLRAIERFIGDAVRSTRPRKRQLTDEEKKAIRARLVAGQERKRKERETAAVTEATKSSKKKEVKDEQEGKS